jgi:NAD(P)-dependent dehydrogenase (short-subunit alcohol dehydrogenase family)
MTIKLPDRPVVIITGASAGVGRAVVRRFAQDGAKIGLIARGIDGLEAARREVEEAGGEAVIYPCDVSDCDEMEAATEHFEKELGPIDIWINAAFAGVLAPFMELDMADYRRVTDVTYLGQVYGARAALKRMMPRNRGSIVLVGSALAYRGIPLQSAYCGAKHAIQGFQDSLRTELLAAKSKVHVSMVQLPGVNTPQFDWIRTTMPKKPQPASPPYQPEIAADAIHFAAYHRRKEVVLGWPSMQAIWGEKFVSPLVDRYLAATGISGQQAQEPVTASRKDNLYEPVPGDHGAHGRFDSIARHRSPQLWMTTHRMQAALGLGTALVAGGLAWAAGRRGGR